MYLKSKLKKTMCPVVRSVVDAGVAGIDSKM